MFKFPDKDAKPELYKLWYNKIKTFRRAGGKDSFKVTNNTYACEFHFDITDINVSAGRHIKKLKPNVVPSAFTFIKKKSPENQQKRRSPGKRDLITEFVKPKQKKLTPEIIVADSQLDISFQNQKSSSVCKNCERLSSENMLLKETIKVLEEEKHKLEEDLKCSKVYAGSLKKRLFSYDNFITDEKLFRATTGLEVEKFKILYEYLDPGENFENIKYHEPATRDKEEDRSDVLFSPSFLSPASKPGPRPKLTGVDHLFLFLSWLRLGSPLKHSAWLFDLCKSTASRYIITWANFIYFKLGCVPIWPTKDIVIEAMPECFRDTYPNTRVIIDCTELFCQKPFSLTIQSSLFSHYKDHITYKGLIGISPSGAITFVSELYDGSTSDVEIVKRCGILNKELWSKDDDVMADRGFTIKKQLEPLGVTLNIPSFLAGKDQLSQEEVTESQTIAAVRIHVERAIQRIKYFRQIRNELPLTMHGSINQIWTVSCLLCNFMSPLMKQ